MALELLDGTNANIDFSIAYSGTNQTSLKCAFGFMSCTIRRDMTEKTTFCSGGWRQRNPGMTQAFGHLDGYASKGTDFSDPLALMSDTDPKAFVFTADTGCTLSGLLHIVSDGLGLRAAAESSRGVDWESYGEVTSAWVVA